MRERRGTGSEELVAEDLVLDCMIVVVVEIPRCCIRTIEVFCFQFVVPIDSMIFCLCCFCSVRFRIRDDDEAK